MESAFKLMAAETGFVMVHSGDSGTFRILASRNLSESAPSSVTLAEGDGVLWRAWHEGRICVTGDASADGLLSRLAGSDRSVLSAICAPLKHKGRLAGLFCLGNLSYRGSFEQRDAELLAIFADQVTIALENARLFQDLERSLAELKETQDKMIQASKMAAVGQLAAGVAHELNNPIVGILGYAQYSLEKVRDKTGPADLTDKDLANFVKYLGYIEHESQRCKVIIQNLLNYSRKNTVEKEAVQVARVLEETFTFTAHQLEMNHVTLVRDIAGDLPPISGNAGHLQQVFTNIIINAQKAMPEGGTLTVTCRLKEPADGGEPAIEVLFADTGCGMAPEVQKRIFDPFFTTRRVGEGTGLGLSLSQGIVRNHGGDIAVASAVGKGTTFTITFPVSGGVEETGPVEEPYAVVFGGKR